MTIVCEALVEVIGAIDPRKQPDPLARLATAGALASKLKKDMPSMQYRPVGQALTRKLDHIREFNNFFNPESPDGRAILDAIAAFEERPVAAE
jgi:hypothetical protein